jgi:hypothetical protein
MYRATWSWLVPVLAAAGVFAGVLATTPPGFRAIADLALGPPRGVYAYAAAYTLGSAASLALVTLLVLAGLIAGIDFVRRRLS